MAENKYPEDEFDLLAAERAVRGAHRRRESNRSWWIALVAVLVCAPLFGWAVINFMGVPSSHSTASGTSSTSAEASATTQESQSAEPTDEASSDAASTDAATDEATATEEPTPTDEATTASVDFSKAILVLNASTVNGLAATKQGILQNAGFTSVSVGNYQYTRPAASQIYYSAESDAATVAAVANALGISSANFILNANATGGDQIVVVLAGDV